MRTLIARAMLVAPLLVAASSASAQDCLFNDGFDDVVSPCASLRGCPVPVPNPAAAAQIDTLRQQPDGATDGAINGALVTYRTPAIGGDPAGFFLQATRPGPALFVAVDPASLVPPPQAGDVVNLRVTQLATALGQRRATAVADFGVTGTGALVQCLVQDLTNATDVVTNIAGYESEVIRLSGVVTGAFSAAGSGFEAAQVATPAILSEPNLRLRLPITVRDSIDLVTTCTFDLGATPLWRANAVAQPTARLASEIALAGCPAPVVVGAASTSAMSARVDFSRRIAPTSVSPSGSQFPIDQGLAATSALVNGRSVTIGTTPQQVGITYNVSAISTITDTQGTPIGLPNSAQFAAFAPRAVARINELNANIASGCDLVELRVVTAGTMAGMRLGERTADVLTFAPFQVQVNDVVIVHFNGGSATCNPGSATSETTSVTEQPAATFTGNFDSAFDWHVADTGITNTDNVLTLYAADGTIMDAVFVSDDPTGTAAADTEAQAAIVAAATQWQVVGGGIPPGGFIDDAFNANAVQDLNGTATTRAGLSIQRTNNLDTNDVQNWGMANSTFGLQNAGQ